MRSLKIVLPQRAALFVLIVFVLGINHLQAADPPDANDRVVRYPESPRRIVSLVPAVTGILTEIGAGDRIVGVTYHDTQPAVAHKTVVGGFFSPAVDKILELSPDIVMVSSLHEAVVENCDAVGIPTLNLDLSTLPRSMEAMATLGSMVGREAEARALQSDIQRQLDLIRSKVDAIPESERLRTIRLMGRDRIKTPGDDSFQNQLITAAGGIAPVFGQNGAIIEITPEQWRQFNPQVVYGCYGEQHTAKILLDQPGWREVEAVRNGRIYYFPCDLTCRAGARMGDFVAWLSARLYGKHFSQTENLTLANEVIGRRDLSVGLSYVKHAAVVHSRIYDFNHKSLLINFNQPMKVVSTLDGMHNAVTAVGNHYFPPPCWYIGHDSGVDGLKRTVCEVLGRSTRDTALLFTGADMDHLAVQRKTFQDIVVYALVTAGAKSNAMRAAKDEGRYYEPGTINMVLMTNMALSARAMNRAVIATTEAKSAALQDLDIRSSYTSPFNGATGTGTDNIIVVQGVGGPIDNSGGHTKMGELIGRAVYQGVREALYRQNGFASGRSVLKRLKERNISMRRLLNGDDGPCGLKPHEFAAAMETLLLDPRYGSFVEAAFSISDDFEQGLVSDLVSFRAWAGNVAQQIAGGPIEKHMELIEAGQLPMVLHEALNALANGVRFRQEQLDGK